MGMPTPDMEYGFSGGNDSMSTSCLLIPAAEVGVVLLLNTRLDQLYPAVTAHDIATNIGNIILNQPYEYPSSREFYTPWVLVDSLMLLLFISLIWQCATLLNRKNEYPAARRSNQTLTWVVIFFDLLILIGILALPTLANTSWTSVVIFRPDFGIPLVVIALCHGVIGVIKIVKILRKPKIKLEPVYP
jgi:uncharacterized integral membrane protein